MNYVRSNATISKRTPRVRTITAAMVTTIKTLVRDGRVVKGKVEAGGADKIYTAPKDADGNTLINARVIWRAVKCTMAMARKILAKLIEDGDVVTEDARYSELHGEA